MATPLRLLIVEDSADDATLLVRELGKAGFDIESERVDSEPQFLAALEKEWDVIVSDFAMPGFGGMRAYDLLQESGRDVPFILVSGRIGEEMAAEAMKRGVADYVLKDNLTRLAPAVRRELHEAALRGERGKLADDLRLSEAKYSILIENSPQGVAIVQDHRIVFANPAFVQMYGYGSEAELRALPATLNLYSTDERDRIAQYRDARLGGDPAPQAYEAQGLRKDGSMIWVETVASRVEWEGGPAIQLLNLDISRRKQAEAELRESQQLLRTVFDALPLWVTVLDTEQRHLLVNRTLLEEFGIPEEQIVGRTFGEIGIGSPEEVALIMERDRQSTEKRQRTEYSDEPLTTPDGRGRQFHVIRNPLRDVEGRVTGLVRVIEDVTEKMVLEEQFRQAQKMESVGRLAGGVAHDFNNMLSVILAFTDSLLDRFAGEQDVREELQEIREAGRRAAVLTRQLLAFSRRQILELKPLQMSEVVSGLEKFLGRLIGEDIRVEYKLAPDLPLVMADEGQIEQILMNLVVNARDAMPEGGRLLVETAISTLDDAYTETHVAVTPGDYVQLAVTDSGTGMDEATRLKIFEPFFTTKGQGKGTGLGLATVYGIVKQLEGNIWVYSELGKGTTLKIYLPLLKEPAAEEKVEAQAAEERPATETILIVEDDDAVRRAAERILGAVGYRVIAQPGGAEALEMLSGFGEPIHLLLTDVVMPDMSGKELTDRFLALRPGTPVVYMSGYTDNAIAHQGVLDAGVDLLQKPFNRDSLRRKVREVLDRAGP